MSDRLRLVVMGDSYVGKSAIVKRFLFGNFVTNHVATVEDLYSRDYEVGGTSLKVDILDTAGDAQFPAMRRLSIASAHAFLLVYSVTDPLSFVTVKQRFEEIREQRADFQEIPIVVAGNKVDMVRDVEPEDIQDWVQSDLPKQRTKVLECSAAENMNIREIFKTFLLLSKINLAPKCGYGNSSDDTALKIPSGRMGSVMNGDDSPSSPSGLRRNLSAYGRLKSHASGGNNKNNNALAVSQTQPLNHQKVDRQGSSGPASNSASPQTSPREIKFLGFNFSPFGSPTAAKGKSASEDSQQKPHLLGVDPFLRGNRTPKRSRSLIRRSSRKAKQQMQNMHNTDDCVVS